MTRNIPSSKARSRNWQRIPLMAFALVALLAGLWAGLLRLGWHIPPLSAQLLIEHGPLMVSGFLGTLISLERAVALSQLQQGRRVYFLAPLLAGLGTVALLLPVPPFIPRLLLTLAALGFVFIFVIIYRMQPSIHNAVMGLGVLLWLMGNGLWLVGLPIFRVVPWWAGFLVLTIAGERLELARMCNTDAGRSNDIYRHYWFCTGRAGLISSRLRRWPSDRRFGAGRPGCVVAAF